MSTPNVSEARVEGPEMIVTRLIDAPRALVFGVWTDKEYLAKWWGPNGFTTTTREMNFAPGGLWRFTMHGPDGTDYPNLIKFREIVQNELITYAHSGDDEVDVHFEARITFEEREGKTLITLRSTFATAEALEQVVKNYGALEGGKEHLGRLAEYVEAKQAN